ncbi:alkaline phosphatase D family protein [Actinopolymorpha pittospori]|uniref:Alkaline phosphatase D n=1 Tax=Actinopolymorpha pittospori TaxID=648752 RepID=A0A927N8Y1_9ACTN|nr:alkaline phosphatase D family protein [Actinopolymorpha pittospori]MBE1610540.1 alkaline phosphatase D [Actinopolymorpha pittospori]
MPARPDPLPPAPPGHRRRSFLALSGVSAAAFALGTGRAVADDRTTGVPADPFQLGVASGEPEPDGVVLWTRLAPDPLAEDGHGGMPLRPTSVQYEVAEDERFTRIAARGAALATPELGHSIHVEVRGLAPAREYFYRFRAGRDISPVGRTKTAPAADASPAAFRFAAASCQAWYHGYFTAYRHMAEEDLDVVFFLGDYIYEYAINASNLWREGVSVAAAHNADVLTLEQYRLRYALFKSDPDLQRLHARVPWIVTSDDHEVVNNYAADFPQYDVSPEDFLRRRSVAYRAYYENLPLRAALLPSGPAMPLYRRLRYGRLAALHVLDTRQYRDDYPCDGAATGTCDEANDPNRSILGPDQERWLFDGLGASDTTWNVLTQQVVMASIDRTIGAGTSYSFDQWDGFTACRDRLFDVIQQRRVANPVVLTGDIHRSVAAELKADWTDPDSATVGTELIASSIGSNGDGTDTDSLGPIWLSNPHVKLYNARRGYVSCTMTPTELTSDFRVVPYVQRQGAPINSLARFVTEAGRPGLNPA